MDLLSRFGCALDEALDAPGAWRAAPDCSDRFAWTTLAARQPVFARRLIALAESNLGRPWPELLASTGRRFAVDGDRERWQAASYGRRQRLAAATLAACLTSEQRFVDEAADGLWLISEEASWCIAAHWHLAIVPRQPPQALPRQDRHVVDIFAAETAQVLAESTGLLAPRLDAIAPAITDRIRRQVHERVLAPVLAHQDWFWWPGQHNWSVWIASNLLGAGAYLCQDRDTDRAVVRTCLGIIDRFTARYAEDGACDEGPGYWAHAAGSLLLALEILHDRSGGRIDVFAEAKFRRMCRYLEDLRLDGDCFAVVADCPPQVELPVHKLARMASRTGDADLQRLADRALRHDEAGAAGTPLPTGGDLTNWLRRLLWVEPASLRDALSAIDRPVSVWLPSRQLLIARSEPREGVRLSIAAKAGSNAESHNHNDVGQVIVVGYGRPLLIDPGVGIYRREHFSPQRYTLWTQNHLGHDVPVINGHGQHAATGWGHVKDDPDPEPVAREVRCGDDGDSVVLELDAAACYPRAAAVRQAQRTIRLDRASTSLHIRDRIAVAAGPLQVTVSWLTPADVVREAAATVLLDGAWRLAVHGPGAVIELEEQPTSDPQLAAAWGQRLVRIRCTGSTTGRALDLECRLSPA